MMRPARGVSRGGGWALGCLVAAACTTEGGAQSVRVTHVAEVVQGEPESTYVPPVVDHRALCWPCDDDGTCSSISPGASCVPYGAVGSFCGTACSVIAPCPGQAGEFDCLGGRCVLHAGTCACPDGADGATTGCKAVVGPATCDGTRACAGGVLGECQARGVGNERCNGIDDNCDGRTDEGYEQVGTPCDGDDTDACADGTWRCAPDGLGVVCDDDEQAPFERCNGFDDDCDGLTDEDFPELGQACDGADLDKCKDGVMVCDGFGVVCDDDAETEVEACNGKDDDCDGLTDEDFATLNQACDGPDDDLCKNGKIACKADGSGVECVGDTAAPPETCNGKDDDCDGLTDEDLNCPVAPTQVCYPGVDGAWTTCFALVQASVAPLPDYAYPSSADPRYAAPARFIDLQGLVASTKLAKNFALSEFMQVAKGRYALFSPDAVVHFQAVRTALGVPLTVKSGFRNPLYNDAVEGASSLSRHTYGDAADVTAGTGATLQAVLDACTAEGADFTQLYATHVHCDWRDDALPLAFFGGVAAAAPSLPIADEGASKNASPWHQLWGDVVTSAVDADGVELQAVWGEAFDEGVPWVRWVVTPPGAATTVAEPVTTLRVPRASRVAWVIGGVIEGELTVP